MGKNRLDELEKLIRRDTERRRREKERKAREEARHEAFLRKKRENCKRILKTRGELAKEVRRLLPSYQKLLASPEWARLNRALDYINRERHYVKECQDIKLPAMSINWSVPAAFLSRKWDGLFNWQIGGRIVLRHSINIHAAKYIIGPHHEYDLAIFSTFEKLAVKPLLHQPPEKFSSGALDVASGEAEAAVILCTRRLLECIRKGLIVDMVAGKYQDLIPE